MQHGVVMSGIGGQGIVVGTKLIGYAATKAGKYCLHYAQYGGEMRGTKCECTMTVSDQPVTAPPLVSQPDVALIMHPESVAPIVPALVPGGLCMINSSLIGLETARMRDDVEWLFVPVTDVGKQVGHLMVATMVMIAAFAAETNLVDVAGIRSSLTEVIPAYRHKLLEMDDLGLARGTEIIAATPVLGRDPGAAWPQESEWRQKAFRFNSSTDYLFRRSSNPIPV